MQSGAYQGGTQPRRAPSRVREGPLEVSLKLKARKMSRKRGRRRHSRTEGTPSHVKARTDPRMLPPRPFFSGSHHIFTVMQAYLAAQRTLSGFLLACLHISSLCLSVLCPPMPDPFFQVSSDGARPCKPSPAPLWSEKSQSASGSSRVCPHPLCGFPLFLLTPPPLSQQEQPQTSVLHNMLTSQAVCLCSQRFPLQNNLLFTLPGT